MQQLYFILAISACFGAGELANYYRVPAEWSRKFVHVTACLVISGYSIFGLDLKDLLPISLVFSLILFFTKKIGVLASLSSVDRETSGEVYLPVAVACLCIFDVSPAYFSIAFLVLGFADAGASIFGQFIKSPSYNLSGSKKTVAGTSAFLVLSYMVVHIAILGLSLPSDIYVFCGMALIATTLACAENLGHKGSDNLIVPLVAVVLLVLCQATPLSNYTPILQKTEHQSGKEKVTLYGWYK